MYHNITLHQVLNSRVTPSTSKHTAIYGDRLSSPVPVSPQVINNHTSHVPHPWVQPQPPTQPQLPPQRQTTSFPSQPPPHPQAPQQTSSSLPPPWVISSAPPTSPSTLSNLAQKYGLNTEHVASLAATEQLHLTSNQHDVAATLHANLAQLCALHVSTARCGELLRSYPQLMLSPMELNIDFLRNYGLPNQVLKSWAYTQPNALGQTQHAMGTILLALHNLGLDQTLVLSMLARCPRLLEGAPVEQIEYLLSLGCARENVCAAASRAPRVLTMTRAEVSHVGASLHGVGLPPRAAAVLISEHPTLLGVAPEHVVQVGAFLRSTGMSRTCVGHVLWREPELLHTNVSVLERKWQFLKEELGGAGDDLAAFPAFLLASLQHRVGPRVAAARSFGRSSCLLMGGGGGVDGWGAADDADAGETVLLTSALAQGAFPDERNAKQVLGTADVQRSEEYSETQPHSVRQEYSGGKGFRWKQAYSDAGSTEQSAAVGGANRWSRRQAFDGMPKQRYEGWQLGFGAQETAEVQQQVAGGESSELQKYRVVMETTQLSLRQGLFAGQSEEAVGQVVGGGADPCVGSRTDARGVEGMASGAGSMVGREGNVYSSQGSSVGHEGSQVYDEGNGGNVDGSCDVEQTDESLFQWQIRLTQQHFHIDLQQKFRLEAATPDDRQVTSATATNPDCISLANGNGADVSGRSCAHDLSVVESNFSLPQQTRDVSNVRAESSARTYVSFANYKDLATRQAEMDGSQMQGLLQDVCNGEVDALLGRSHGVAVTLRYEDSKLGSLLVGAVPSVHDGRSSKERAQPAHNARQQVGNYDVIKPEKTQSRKDSAEINEACRHWGSAAPSTEEETQLGNTVGQQGFRGDPRVVEMLSLDDAVDGATPQLCSQTRADELQSAALLSRYAGLDSLNTAMYVEADNEVKTRNSEASREVTSSSQRAHSSLIVSASPIGSGQHMGVGSPPAQEQGQDVQSYSTQAAQLRRQAHTAESARQLSHSNPGGKKSPRKELETMLVGERSKDTSHRKQLENGFSSGARSTCSGKSADNIKFQLADAINDSTTGAQLTLQAHSSTQVESWSLGDSRDQLLSDSHKQSYSCEKPWGNSKYHNQDSGREYSRVLKCTWEQDILRGPDYSREQHNSRKQDFNGDADFPTGQHHARVPEHSQAQQRLRELNCFADTVCSQAQLHFHALEELASDIVKRAEEYGEPGISSSGLATSVLSDDEDTREFGQGVWAIGWDEVGFDAPYADLSQCEVTIYPALDLRMLCEGVDEQFCQAAGIDLGKYRKFKLEWQSSVGVRWVGGKW